MVIIGGDRGYKNCIICGTSFEVVRDWQLFCGGKCRVIWNNGLRSWANRKLQNDSALMKEFMIFLDTRGQLKGVKNVDSE